MLLHGPPLGDAWVWTSRPSELQREPRRAGDTEAEASGARRETQVLTAGFFPAELSRCCSWNTSPWRPLGALRVLPQPCPSRGRLPREPSTPGLLPPQHRCPRPTFLNGTCPLGCEWQPRAWAGRGAGRSHWEARSQVLGIDGEGFRSPGPKPQATCSGVWKNKR